MTQNEFLFKMQDEVLDIEREMTMESKLDEIEEWDSLAFVSFIAMAKTFADKKIDRAAVQNAKTVGDLYTLLQ